MNRILLSVALIASWSFALLAAESDWPMWKYDAGRTADTKCAIPAELHLQWTRTLEKPRQAWQDKANKPVYFDVSYEPIVMDGTMFVASMNSDSITAYDTATGEREWRFYTDGPVRFAPVANKGRVYAASDDGNLYCLKASDGNLLWVFQGAPENSRILGNHRLISRWPARGAPVLHEGVIYFAAGIWPSEGTFIYALDAETGKLLWGNSSSGSEWITQPHSALSFAGVAPQGYLAVGKDRLLVPSGRSVPGAFNRQTGKFLYYHAGDRSFGKGMGGYAVTAVNGKFINSRAMYDIENGKGVTNIYPGLNAKDARYVVDGSRLVTSSYDGSEPAMRSSLGKRIGPAMIKADNVIYCANEIGDVSAVDVSTVKKPKIIWSGKVEGAVWNMIAANNRLFVVTRSGSIYCFGEKAVTPKKYVSRKNNITHGADEWQKKAKTVLENIKSDEGYCVLLGLGTGALCNELLLGSKLHIIVIDNDTKKIKEFRREMDAAGLYGLRVSAYVSDPFKPGLPQYLANAVVSEHLTDAGWKGSHDDLDAIYSALRPYGGCAFLPIEQKKLLALVKKDSMEDADISSSNGLTMLRRKGALPGSAAWTHQYADAGNSVMSRDKLVKPPFGLLWFGGPTNDEILPRHGHGPSPQIVGGRLIIEGENILRAVDVYTGRLLWQKDVKKIGQYYNNTKHHPGANEVGGNYISLEDAVYLMSPQSCMLLDPATGNTKKVFSLPKSSSGKRPNWGFINVWDDYLVAAASPVTVNARNIKQDVESAKEVLSMDRVKGVKFNDNYGAASETLVVMNRHTGKALWSRAASNSFRHNTIVIGDGKIFCIDGISAQKLNYLARRGYKPKTAPVLYALDINTGEVLWKTDKNVFGTWLGYSREKKLLIQAGSRYRDRAFDETDKGIVVYKADSGSVVWQDLRGKYIGPIILRHDEFITNGDSGYGYDISTGRKSGWKWTRKYGCNTAIGSEHILSFRSGAAGYYDLGSKGGTGNLGGFKSGCTSSLIPADGVLNAPDYTRTCTCSYQNMTSLAFVHRSKSEMWLFDGKDSPGSLGINYGAPGDRRAENGTLWRSEGKALGRLQPDKWNGCYRHHTSLFEGSEMSWIAASGIEGAETLKVALPTRKTHTIRLFFAEPNQNAVKGDRVFDLSVNDKTLLSDFDIIAEAGSSRKLVIKEFTGINAVNEISIKFKPKTGKSLLCGIEIKSE